MTTYPDDTLVQVKYPLQDDQPREAWPYYSV